MGQWHSAGAHLKQEGLNARAAAAWGEVLGNYHADKQKCLTYDPRWVAKCVSVGGCWCIRKKDRKRRNIKPNWLCNCWFDISCLNDYYIHGGDSVREEQSRVQTWGCVWGRWKEGGKERVLKIEHRFLLKNSAAASHCQSGANRFSWMLWLGVCVIRNKKTERTFFRRYRKYLLPLFHPFFSSRFFLCHRLTHPFIHPSSETEVHIWSGAEHLDWGQMKRDDQSGIWDRMMA